MPYQIIFLLFSFYVRVRGFSRTKSYIYGGLFCEKNETAKSTELFSQ